MSNLVSEILLRLAKALAALLLGLILYVVAISPLGAAASFELALLCWVSAAAFVMRFFNAAGKTPKPSRRAIRYTAPSSRATAGSGMPAITRARSGRG